MSFAVAAGELHRAARAERRRQEHAVLADHAALCGACRAISIFGHDVAREPGAALRRLGVVFQPRTLDLDLSVAAEPDLSRRAARHRRAARRASARRELLAQIGLADRAQRQGARPFRRTDAARRDRARAAAPAAPAAARRSRPSGSTSRRAPTFSTMCACWSRRRRRRASCGRPIWSTRSPPTTIWSCCIAGACSPHGSVSQIVATADASSIGSLHASHARRRRERGAHERARR